MAKNLIKDTLGFIGSAAAGAREIASARISEYKAGKAERKFVTRAIGPESVFGADNMVKQKKMVKAMVGAGNYKGARDYMNDQMKRAGMSPEQIKSKRSSGKK